MAIKPDSPAWVVDRENQRRALYFALRSRVLSVDEMQEVETHDFHLTVEMNQSYNGAEKRAEFNDALLQQFKLRLEAERSAARADCIHPSQKLLVTVGSKLLYQCEKCKDVIAAKVS